MKIRSITALSLVFGCALLLTSHSVAQQDVPASQEDIRKQLGTIIVTPGNGPNLALADFVARSAGAGGAATTFNSVLQADLDFAAVAGLVGNSLNPKTPVPDPA